MIEERMLTGPEPRKPDPDEAEPSSAHVEGTRRYHRAVLAERKAERIDYHEGMAELHSSLAVEHRVKAARLKEER